MADCRWFPAATGRGPATHGSRGRWAIDAAVVVGPRASVKVRGYPSLLPRGLQRFGFLGLMTGALSRRDAGGRRWRPPRRVALPGATLGRRRALSYATAPPTTGLPRARAACSRPGATASRNARGARRGPRRGRAAASRRGTTGCASPRV